MEYVYAATVAIIHGGTGNRLMISGFVSPARLALLKTAFDCRPQLKK